MEISFYIDVFLCFAVLIIAASMFLVKNSFTAIVLFISLGLVISICWIRLNAIDVAIAEAAIGAGLTGAMLVAAWRKLATDASCVVNAAESKKTIDHNGRINKHLAIKITIVFFVSVFTLALLYGLHSVLPHGNQLAKLAFDNIPLTGVTNPVTAVLLNYRIYDTVFEFAVFLCVAVSVLPYIADTPKPLVPLMAESQVLAIAKVFVPLTIVMAGYMLWIGSSMPGGAFQAASLLAGCLVLLTLSNALSVDLTLKRYKALLSAGLIATFLTIIIAYLQTQVFLTFPVGLAGAYILFIEFFATFAIALALFVCFESINKGHV